MVMRLTSGEKNQSTRIVEHPSNAIVPRNEPHSMSCVAKGTPKPSISWFKDGERLKTLPNRLLFLPGGGLFLRKVKLTFFFEN